MTTSDYHSGTTWSGNLAAIITVSHYEYAAPGTINEAKDEVEDNVYQTIADGVVHLRDRMDEPIITLQSLVSDQLARTYGLSPDVPSDQEQVYVSSRGQSYLIDGMTPMQVLEAFEVIEQKSHPLIDSNKFEGSRLERALNKRLRRAVARGEA